MQYVDATKLRAYFFGNMYISPIQQGIQAAHVVTKLFTSYSEDGVAGEMLHDWGRNGVTKILLNGGYQSNLEDIHSTFEFIAPKLGLPYMKFHEEEAALNGALTSVGIVVPEEIYSKSADLMFDWTHPPTDGSPSGAYLYGCFTPADILVKLLAMDDKFADRELYEDFLEAALNITLKTARLA